MYCKASEVCLKPKTSSLSSEHPQIPATQVLKLQGLPLSASCRNTVVYIEGSDPKVFTVKASSRDINFLVILDYIITTYTQFYPILDPLITDYFQNTLL